MDNSIISVIQTYQLSPKEETSDQYCRRCNKPKKSSSPQQTSQSKKPINQRDLLNYIYQTSSDRDQLWVVFCIKYRFSFQADFELFSQISSAAKLLLEETLLWVPLTNFHRELVNLKFRICSWENELLWESKMFVNFPDFIMSCLQSQEQTVQTWLTSNHMRNCESKNDKCKVKSPSRHPPALQDGNVPTDSCQCQTNSIFPGNNYFPNISPRSNLPFLLDQKKVWQRSSNAYVTR